MGVHLGALLYKVDSPEKLPKDLRGRFVDLAPNKKTELDLRLPPITEPGKYLLIIDLVDELVHWFHDMGSPIYQFEFEVVPGQLPPSRTKANG